MQPGEKELLARAAFVGNLRAHDRAFVAFYEAVEALEEAGEPLTVSQRLELVARLETVMTRGLAGEVFRTVAEERGWTT
jgi:hypothetical protein